MCGFLDLVEIGVCTTEILVVLGGVCCFVDLVFLCVVIAFEVAG